MAVLGLYPHEDICTKLAVSPEVETSVKSVVLAAPQTSVRPVELLTILLLVSQSSLDTSRTALTGGQLEILGGEAKYSWALMLHSSGKWRISAILSGSTGRTLPPCCIPKPDL